MALVATLGAALFLAKLIVRDRSQEDRDEVDVTSILQSRRLRMRSRPFIGGTILVVAGRLELDLRRVVPAPTGIEIEVLLIGGVVRIVVPPNWRREVAVRSRAARIDSMPTGLESDSPLFRLTGQAWMSRVVLIGRRVPSALASSRTQGSS
jgi:hypothetical protein